MAISAPFLLGFADFFRRFACWLRLFARIAGGCIFPGNALDEDVHVRLLNSLLRH